MGSFFSAWKKCVVTFFEVAQTSVIEAWVSGWFKGCIRGRMMRFPEPTASDFR